MKLDEFFANGEPIPQTFDRHGANDSGNAIPALHARETATRRRFTPADIERMQRATNEKLGTPSVSTSPVEHQEQYAPGAVARFNPFRRVCLSRLPDLLRRNERAYPTARRRSGRRHSNADGNLRHTTQRNADAKPHPDGNTDEHAPTNIYIITIVYATPDADTDEHAAPDNNTEPECNCVGCADCKRRPSYTSGLRPYTYSRLVDRHAKPHPDGDEHPYANSELDDNGNADDNADG